MTDQEHRAAIAHNWLEKASEALEIGEVSYEKENFISCVNRLYYAAFYAASAVLANEGIEYGKHTAVRAAVNRDLVKPGRITARFGAYYNKLFDDRLAGDYEPSTHFDKEELRALIADTKEFIPLCRSMVSS